MTAGGLASLRRANASRPFVQLNPKASQAVAEDLTLLKAECFATGRGYAVARKEKKTGFLSRNCSPRAHKRPPSLFVESAGFTVASRRRATAAAGCSKTEQNHGLWHDKVFIETLSMHGAYMALMLN